MATMPWLILRRAPGPAKTGIGERVTRSFGRSWALTARSLRFLVAAAILLTVVPPYMVALLCYPEYPHDPSSIRVILPTHTVIVERTTSFCVRITRFLRSEAGAPDAASLENPMAWRLNSETPVSRYAEFVSPVVATVHTERSPVPDFLPLSPQVPYGLVAEYGWPFAVVRSFVTGTYNDCATRQGTLHSAIPLSASQQLIPTYYGWWPRRIPKGFYMADLPFRSVPTRVSVMGTAADIVILTIAISAARMAWLFAIALRRDMRGRCCECGYDLSGVTGARCPECGGPAPCSV
jgi:hypothetical protein